MTSETVHYYAGFPGKSICGGETSLAVAPITTIRQDHVTCERCKELFGIYSSPAPVTSNERSLPQRIATRVVEAVCELPDYTSPDDQPDLLTCTVQELEHCVLRAFEQLEYDREMERGPDSLPVETKAPLDPTAVGFHAYAMSESHLGGYRLIVGFDTLEQVQRAHEFVVQAGKRSSVEPSGA